MWSLVMGVWQPVANLRDYVSQNPPAATFFLCLLTLTISFICFSSYSYTHTLPNPDTTKDWNHLLSTLSQFQLCMRANASSEPVSPQMDRDATTDFTNTAVSSLYLKVPLVVTTKSDSGSLKGLGLQTQLRAKQLQLGANEIVNLTLELFSGIDTYTCLAISAPANVIPLSLLPPECPTSETNISYIHVEASNQPPTASQTCYTLNSKNDPALTIMLTWEEQSVAVRHLLEVSVGLLGICLVFCLAACLTRAVMRRHNWNGQDL
uniref:TMEM248/TMEM219 domain-containing protein n=1 Tax=Mola mola TaxID=94237 RepID=A0A3Q4BQU4_MOLML